MGRLVTILIYCMYGLFFSCIIMYAKQPQMFFGMKKPGIETRDIYNNYKISYFYIAFVCLLTFLFFSVFRRIDDTFTVGTDARTYRAIFSLATQSWRSSLVLQGMEPLYASFVWIIRRFTADFKVFLFFYNTILFLMVYYIVKKSNLKISRYVLLSFSILIFTMIIDSFNLMRNMLAIFVSEIAVIKMSAQKYKSAFVIFILSVLIHYSAVIVLAAFIVYLTAGGGNFKLKRFYFFYIAGFIFVMVIAVFSKTLMGFLFSKRYTGYLNNGETGFMRYIFVCWILIIASIKWKQLKSDNKLNMISFCVVASNLYIYPLQRIFPIAYRMFLFADISIFILMAELFKISKLKNPNNYFFELMIRSSFIFYLLLYAAKFFMDDSYGVLIYKNALFD